MSARTCEAYEIACPCGKTWEIPAKPIDDEKAVTCPTCGRKASVEWRGQKT
jgi:hypothetical protein